MSHTMEFYFNMQNVHQKTFQVVTSISYEQFWPRSQPIDFSSFDVTEHQ